VKRRRPDFSTRPRLEPQARAGVADVVLSFSDLKYFFECPYQFKLRILYGFNAPIPEALGYGKSLHDALSEVHGRALEGEMPSPINIPALLDRHLHLPFAYPSLIETLRESADGVLAKYFADNADLFDKLEFSEKKIEIVLDDGVTVVGRIDLVRRLDNNETTIVDFKTSERSQEEDVTEMQLHIYVVGHEALTGRTADFVEIYELEDGRRKPRSVDEEFVTDVKAAVRGAADSLRNGQLSPAPRATVCATCDYRRLCSSAL
jgi:DNA helicase-2/ATP-dependent DNA helicase PcrA